MRRRLQSGHHKINGVGNLAGAEAKYKEALELDNQIGYKRGSAFAIAGIADVLTHRGHLAQARQRSQEAANTRRDLGEQLTGAISQTQLATIKQYCAACHNDAGNALGLADSSISVAVIRACATSASLRL